VFYTNGTTRTDWADIVFTDTSNNLLGYWKENNTETSINSTWWVKIPYIWSANNTTIKMYYGNSSLSTSCMNGLNTFPFFDDFISSSINTTQWTTVNGTVALNSGNMTITNTGVIRSNASIGFSQNYTVRTRTHIPSNVTQNWFGFMNSPAGAPFAIFHVDSAGSYRHTFFTSDVKTGITSFVATYHVFDIKIAKTTTNYTIDNVSNWVDAQTYTSPIRITFEVYSGSQTLLSDWVFVRKSYDIEPIIINTNYSGVSAPVANFTMSNTTGTSPLLVNFTDTSTNSPTAWNWSFNGTNFSDARYPNFTFTSVGNYSVTLNASNSAGFSNITKYVEVFSSIVSNFTSNVTSGIPLTAVLFNDTTTGSPTVWCWSYTNVSPGNGTQVFWSTTQNTTQVFGIGNWLIKLNASNGVSSNISMHFVNISPVCNPYLTFDGRSDVLTFNNTGTCGWIVPNDIGVSPTNASNISYLIIAGGGSGGVGYHDLPAGGGGAGGVLNGLGNVTSGSVYFITIGTGAPSSHTIYAHGTNGTNSSFSLIGDNAVGGGGGGGPLTLLNDGFNGGSGGGGGRDLSSYGYSNGAGGSNTSGQGYSGGNGTWVDAAGGGGGAGQRGVNGGTNSGGQGGNGTLSNITGCVTYYAGGGGGSYGRNTYDYLPAGGLGGGGRGGNYYTPNAVSGSFYGAGGGGSGGNTGFYGWSGGGYQGVVIIRYYNATEQLPVANFSASNWTGVSPLLVNFTDTSTNEPTSWNWTFGGANFSSAQNPSYTFTGVGNYTVVLNASNGAGFSNITKYINVTAILPIVNFTSNVTSGLIPLNVMFNDTSSNTPTAWNWSFGDGTWQNGTTQDVTHVYSTGGVYTVSLIALNGAGSNSTTKSDYITVYNTTVSGFDANVTFGLSPLNVGFNVTTANDNATQWNWSFGDGTWQNGTTQNATHVYSLTGTYNVTEIASNAYASNTTTKTFYIVVSGQAISGFVANATTGTAPLNVGFDVTVADDNATQWNWSFGDGTWQNGTTQNATHVYSNGGVYTVMEIATNNISSNSTTILDYITVYNQTIANISSNVTSGLATLAVQFDASNSTNATWWNWSFGDGTVDNITNVSPVHSYSTSGNYTVSLTTSNDGFGANTQTNYYIQVYDRVMTGFTANVTEGLMPLNVGFTVDGAEDNATHWNWSFGDGTWQNGTTQNVTHVYSTGGIYTVTEIASNPLSTNSTTRSDYITVYNQTSNTFSMNITSGLIPLPVVFTATSVNASWWNWSWGDGTWSNLTNGTLVVMHIFTSAQNNTVNLTTSNEGYGLYTTTHYVNSTYYSPLTVFTATPMSGNVPLTVVFTDGSINGPTSWYWDFGDGTFNTSQNTAHTYSVAGSYTVILTTSNAFGSSNSSKIITVFATGPVANFTQDNTSGAAPLTVQFTDTSSITNITATSWYWQFGDGSTSVLQNPSHAYALNGVYMVNLTVTDEIGTSKSSNKLIYVTSSLIPIPDFVGVPTYGTSPLTVQFTDLTTGAVTAWNWSFGDGNYSTSQNPSHIYVANGQYTVILVVANGGYTNYTTKIGYINVGIGTNVVNADFVATPTSGNYPLTVQFYDQSVCTPLCNSWNWDLDGDGSTDSNAQNPSYTYTYPLTYSPKLIASNGVNSGSKIKIGYIVVGPTYVPTTIPQPTGSWQAGYQNNTTGLVVSFQGNSSIDLNNATYLKYWLQNFTTTGNFNVYGFVTSVMAPLMHVFGFWIFLIIWGLYLFAVWIRTQDVTMPLIIGIISMGTFGLLFPKESLPVIIIMFVICGAIIIYKLAKE